MTTPRTPKAFISSTLEETDAWWGGLADRPELARPRWDYPNHPRETVSWYEAIAFSRWLDARLRASGSLWDGWKIRLPTEHEWEEAARGKDGREFPWGDIYESGWTNIDETWRADNAGPYRVGQTSAVGIYPNGASPFGALDMAGNVWEWCLNKCGGSWNRPRAPARCASRYGGQPEDRNDLIGFRVVLCAAPVV